MVQKKSPCTWGTIPYGHALPAQIPLEGGQNRKNRSGVGLAVPTVLFIARTRARGKEPQEPKEPHSCRSRSAHFAFHCPHATVRKRTARTARTAPSSLLPAQLPRRDGCRPAQLLRPLRQDRLHACPTSARTERTDNCSPRRHGERGDAPRTAKKEEEKRLSTETERTKRAQRTAEGRKTADGPPHPWPSPARPAVHAIADRQRPAYPSSSRCTLLAASSQNAASSSSGSFRLAHSSTKSTAACASSSTVAVSPTFTSAWATK